MSSASSSPRFWILSAVSVINVLTSLGFSLAAVIDTGLSGSGIGHTTAMYAAVRSLALAAGVLLVVAVRSRSGLLALGFVLTLVQALDATIGDELPKVAGPAAFAVATAAAAWALWREPRRRRAGAGG